MNRFRINSGYESVFEERWANRKSYLDQSPGFVRFRLLTSRLPQGPHEYLSYSEWIDQTSFEAWMNGENSRRAHSEGTPVPREAYAGPPEFRGYEVFLDQVPGRRTDFRSVAMDVLVEKNFSHESGSQKEVREAHDAQDLPPINIGAFEGRILEILLRANGSKRGIELGTLGGYSGSWLARALPEDGRLITIEKDPERAEVARKNLERMGCSHKVEVKVGAGRDVLATLDSLKDLDFVFIDADKQNYGHYVRWALPRLRKGGLLLADNAYIWGGMHYYGRDPNEVPYSKHEHLHSFDQGAFEGMSDCWNQLQVHPEYASLILPTGEGLGIGVRI